VAEKAGFEVIEIFSDEAKELKIESIVNKIIEKFL
jgi:hypothetical protein